MHGFWSIFILINYEFGLSSCLILQVMSSKTVEIMSKVLASKISSDLVSFSVHVSVMVDLFNIFVIRISFLTFLFMCDFWFIS